MQILFIILSFFTGFFISFFIFKNKNNELNIKNIKLEAALENVKAKDDYKEIIKKEFANLACEAILEKNKSVDEINRKNIEIQLNPIKEKLKEFQAKVEDFNLNNVKYTQSLKEQIEYLSNQNKMITTQTEKLANAINKNSKSRGDFGEMILEKLLRNSGLIDKKDDPIKGNYLLQCGFKNLNNPDGNKIKPDAVIFLADENKNIVVDSKASFTGYLEYANAENEDVAQKSIEKFYEDILNCIKALENKYTNLEGLNTPDFTLMFIPFEASMGLIYSNAEIIKEASKRNVVIAGPSTLLATLRTINYTWANKNRADNIKEILKTGEGIYLKCQTFIIRLEELSASFARVWKNFDETFKTLKGRNGLFGQIAKFKDLGFTPLKPIEEKYLTDSIITEENNLQTIK